MMDLKGLKVSLYIPTLNAGADWLPVLESIAAQTLQLTKKVIIDSGSVDDTVANAKLFGFEVVEIEKSAFNHGATRQALVDLFPEIDICIFLTQDAILANPESLTNLLHGFADPHTDLVYGRQLPHKNAKTLETHARLFNYPPKSATRVVTDKDKLGFKVFFCSNSFCAYRRNALVAVGGFPSDSIMGEDALTAARILLHGSQIAYVADAMVYHSHTYTLKQEFKRYFDTRVFHEQNRWLIDAFGKPTGEGLKFVSSELAYVFKNDLKSIFKSVGSVGAKWLGYKSGNYYRNLPVNILRKISMHKFYWK